MNRNIFGWVLSAAFIAIFIGIGVFVLVVHCQQAWGTSGMRAEFRLFGGCLLEQRPGVWIPANNYREVP